MRFRLEKYRKSIPQTLEGQYGFKCVYVMLRKHLLLIFLTATSSLYLDYAKATMQPQTPDCYIVSGLRRDLEMNGKGTAFSLEREYVNGAKYPIQNCQMLSSWKDLKSGLSDHSDSKPILIYQFTHGKTGGIAITDGGNTQAEEILDILQDLAAKRPVGVVMKTCYSGDVLEKKLVADYLAFNQNKLTPAMSNLCMAVSSAPGRTSWAYEFGDRLDSPALLGPGQDLEDFILESQFGLISSSNWSEVALDQWLIDRSKVASENVFSSLISVSNLSFNNFLTEKISRLINGSSTPVYWRVNDEIRPPISFLSALLGKNKSVVKAENLFFNNEGSYISLRQQGYPLLNHVLSAFTQGSYVKESSHPLDRLRKSACEKIRLPESPYDRFESQSAVMRPMHQIQRLLRLKYFIKTDVEASSSFMDNQTSVKYPTNFISVWGPESSYIVVNQIVSLYEALNRLHQQGYSLDRLWKTGSVHFSPLFLIKVAEPIKEMQGIHYDASRDRIELRGTLDTEKIMEGLKERILLNQR